jgi:hypothetical protein
MQTIAKARDGCFSNGSYNLGSVLFTDDSPLTSSNGYGNVGSYTAAGRFPYTNGGVTGQARFPSSECKSWAGIPAV